MNDKSTYSVDKYLEIIAEKEGITKEEVQQEIGRAVSIALKSPDSKCNASGQTFHVKMKLPPLKKSYTISLKNLQKSHRQRTG